MHFCIIGVILVEISAAEAGRIGKEGNALAKLGVILQQEEIGNALCVAARKVRLGHILIGAVGEEENISCGYCVLLIKEEAESSGKGYVLGNLYCI